MRAAVALAFTVAACTPPPTAGAPDAGVVDSGVVDACAAAQPDACPDGCTALVGVPEAQHCAGSLLPQVPLQCASADRVCDDAITCAADPVDGASHCFPDGCVPAGWSTNDECAVPATCDQGEPQVPANLCVRGEPSAEGELLQAGGRARLVVRPSGCFSSSCTVTFDAACDAIVDGTTVAVTAGFCWGVDDGAAGGCTDDCGGGGSAACLTPALAAGTWTATVGDTSVVFDVPSTLPIGGVCD